MKHCKTCPFANCQDCEAVITFCHNDKPNDKEYDSDADIQDDFWSGIWRLIAFGVAVAFVSGYLSVKFGG